MKFAASDNDHYIQVNRGSGSEPAITRLFIPSGHNFSATTDIQLRGDSTDDMSGSPITLIAYDGSGADVGTGDIDITFTSNQSQYVRLDWPPAQAGQWELPELWLTDTVTLTDGVVPDWTDEYVYSAITLEKGSGESPVIETGAPRRFFEFTYQRLGATDTAALEALITAVGISKPFLFDPPYDDEAALVVRLARPPRTTWDHPVPTAGIKTKRFDLQMIQVLE
jgi:hypothetical protein